MDGIGRTCLVCQTELSSSALFCPKCGQPAGSTAPGFAPGGPGPDDAPTMTQPAFPARPYQAPLPPASYPAPAYDRPAYEQRPRDSRGFEPFQSYPPQVPPPMGPPPMGPHPMGPHPMGSSPMGPAPAGRPPGPSRQPPRRHDGRRSGSSLPLLIGLVVLLVGGGVAGVLIAHPFNRPAIKETASTSASPGPQPSGATGPASPAAPASTASPATSTAAPAVTERQAATNLATMLSQSVSDRAAIISAAGDVGSCGPNLNADAKVFDDAASSRKALLTRLTTMPGRTALPAALLGDLTKAWQASIAADQAYAQWANDENTRGCVANDTSDPGYRATVTPNANATTYKTAFVGEWNPVAAKYGLTRYEQNQL
jgi:hypothetical protein